MNETRSREIRCDESAKEYTFGRIGSDNNSRRGVSKERKKKVGTK